MKCFLDLDGVLVDFIGGALKVHRVAINSFDWPVGHYSVEDKIGLSRSEFFAPMEEDFWAKLEWTAEGRDILKLAETKFGVENVCILTKPSMNKGCVPGKLRWIEQHIPDYVHRNLMGSAKEFCANEYSVLIDDSDHNVNAFRTHGGNAILVPRRWNMLHKVESDGIGVVSYVNLYLNKL